MSDGKSEHVKGKKGRFVSTYVCYMESYVRKSGCKIKTMPTELFVTVRAWRNAK